MSEPELLAFLPLQARRLERVPENPFMFEQMAPTALERRMAVLQGFYLTVESWEGIAKLSQDEPEQLQHHLKSCLKAAGEDTLVEWMNRLAESKETT
jgi:predicted FMN-binding regulatory protein PaiB